jgi:single-strand DNA-binding protein
MKVTHIIGNIGKAPEMKFTPQGKAVTEFSVAVNEGKGENKKTEWVKVVAWDKAAELLNQYAKQGAKIYVSGPTKIDCWIDKATGDAKAQLVLTVREFEFLSSNNTQATTQTASALDEDQIPF